MNIKKTIGWILAFIGVSLFTGICVEITNLKITMMVYGITFLIVGFVILIAWLLTDE